jgi:peptide/nickel transport system ATP-binding protein
LAPIIEVEDLRVSFQMDRGESRVIDDVDIAVQRGEVLGVVGESGSGKSMFASALLDAVVDPGQTAGTVTYRPTPEESVDVLGLNKEELRSLRWEEISMVFQGAMSSFNPVQRVDTHFKETIRAHSGDLDEGMERARELLSDLYLDPDRVMTSYPHELSGGMQQRALIALSLVLEPNVLVMDEPTAALDLLMQRSILELLEDIKEKYDITIVFITHDLTLIAELADRLAVMYAFEFAEVGPKKEILTGATHPYTRALLNATPNLNAGIERMRPIRGSAPDPVDKPSGCPYHPRCSLADETCVESDPPFETVDTNHETACFHWERAREEIPLTFGDEHAPSSSDSGDEIVAERPERSGKSRDSENPVLSLDDVTVYFENKPGLLSFGSEPEVVKAVDGVTLDIPENQVVVLVGESGCGKTTLGRAAIGLQELTDGSVEYRGQDIEEAKHGDYDVDIPFSHIRKSLQIIHQDPGASLNPNRRVSKILNKPLKRWRSDLSPNQREALILKMIEKVGMSPPTDYATRYPHQLSGGEKQRVALIRALLMNPDVILADEAISALDVSLRIEMMDLFLDLQEQFNTSYLSISHDLSNARYFAEKANGLIGIMYLGEIVEIGTAEAILENPQHPYTKALRWATPDPMAEDEGEGQPIRTIDVPDPVDPPSGCKFHTRCPEAREVCKESPPPTENVGDWHSAACYRIYDDHEYWDSPPLDCSVE